MKVALFDKAGHLIVTGNLPDFEQSPDIINYNGLVYTANTDDGNNISISFNGKIYYQYYLANSTSLITTDNPPCEMEPMKEVLYKL